MKPQSLFRRTAWTLAAALLVFQVLAFGAIAYFVTVPLATRATDDLAALMVLAVKTWVELPPATRADFEIELQQRHGLIVRIEQEPLPQHTSFLPYRVLLEQALGERLGKAVSVRTTQNPEFFWADLPMGGQVLQVGFARNRIGAQPSYALSIVFTTLLVVVFATAYFLAGHLTRPLTQFAQAAQAVGRGQAPESLPVTGPAELAALASTINHMALDVRELLANRTTMLAGVSHDLRTPLARLQLAIEMLPLDADPELAAGLRRDLKIMDTLLGQYLELARGMVEEPGETVDLREVVDASVTDARRVGIEIRWDPGTKAVPCEVRPHALERILANLLDNARRYGDTQAIEVECEHEGEHVAIRVLDRGPGIPEAERDAVFRPFHRLESARSIAGGGSGLGLAIARQLADANKWELVFNSRPGGGTIANIHIPCPASAR